VDLQYCDILRWAFAHGCKLVDSSISYRAGRSLLCIRDALSTTGLSARLCIKIGFDATAHHFGRYRHSLHRAFLREQILRTREALGDRFIDWLLLHNPEVQLREIDRELFETLLEEAFALLEEFRADGVIGGYGVATTLGFRVQPDHLLYLNLDRLLTLASHVSASHGFCAVQAPLSIDAPEAAMVFEQAQAMGLVTIGTSPVLPFPSDGRPVHPTIAVAAMRWALSVPAADWVVCGTLNLAHLKANMAVAADLA
jgi:aryl-alcohol dehydrogenase-like predicted oxidoreductase